LTGLKWSYFYVVSKEGILIGTQNSGSSTELTGRDQKLLQNFLVCWVLPNEFFLNRFAISKSNLKERIERENCRMNFLSGMMSIGGFQRLWERLKLTPVLNIPILECDPLWSAENVTRMWSTEKRPVWSAENVTRVWSTEKRPVWSAENKERKDWEMS